MYGDCKSFTLLAIVFFVVVTLFTIQHTNERRYFNNLREEIKQLYVKIESSAYNIQNQRIQGNDGKIDSQIGLLKSVYRPDGMHEAAKSLLIRLQHMSTTISFMIYEQETILKALENMPERQIRQRENFMSYMPWDSITYRNSRQFQMREAAITGSGGLRYYNGLPKFAIGSGWGIPVGGSFKVEFDCGSYIWGVKGDQKADIHTCVNNKRTVDNGCYIETIVDINIMCQEARRLGCMAEFFSVSGNVIGILPLT